MISAGEHGNRPGPASRAKTQPLLVQRDGRVLTLTLNRPGAANALSDALVEALTKALEEIGDARLCVLRGNGRHFCAGFDLSDLDRVNDATLLWRMLRIEHLLQRVYHLPIPTLAIGHGQCVGAGADLFAACWQRLALPETRFQYPGWNFELALGTRRLARLVGEQSARDLLMDTHRLNAEQALAIGLASEVVTAEEMPSKRAAIERHASRLSAYAVERMLTLTRTDTRDADIAAVVASAGRPGLRDRVAAYRDRMLAERAAR